MRGKSRTLSRSYLFAGVLTRRTQSSTFTFLSLLVKTKLLNSTRTASVLEISRRSQLIHGTNNQPISEKIERQNRFQEIKILIEDQDLDREQECLKEGAPPVWGRWLSGWKSFSQNPSFDFLRFYLRLWFSQVHLPQSWANLLWPRSSSCSYVRLLALFQPHCCLRCIVDIAM